MEIVVGVNQERRVQMPWHLRALATALDADIVVANVYRLLTTTSARSRGCRMAGFLIEQAEESLAWARQQLGDRDRGAM